MGSCCSGLFGGSKKERGQFRTEEKLYGDLSTIAELPYSDADKNTEIDQDLIGDTNLPRFTPKRDAVPTSFVGSFDQANSFSPQDSNLIILPREIPASESVKLPSGFTVEYWVYENVVNFVDEVRLIYESVSDSCSPSTCPEMSAGPHFTFLWTDDTTQTPLRCSAREYVYRLYAWINECFDKGVLSRVSQLDVSQDVVDTMKVICKKLFRVYAHVYHHHLQEFTQRNAEIFLNTTFQFFCLFVREYNLISRKEEAPLRKLIKRLVEEPT